MPHEPMSFAHANFEGFAKTTKRGLLSTRWIAILRWKGMCDGIRPHYSTGERGNRVPINLERMLRIH